MAKSSVIPRTHKELLCKIALEAHSERVERIALKVQEFYNTKTKFRMYHGSTNSTRRPDHTTSNVVDTSVLSNIIHVDTNSNLAVVEANVPMDALLEETLKHDLMPLVVTEFPGITVGGAYSGTAAESSSFKHRFFDRTVAEVEMVLANGEVVKCSESENAEVFRGAPGALGTLGVVTLLHIRLQKAAPYVEVTYHPVKAVKEAVDRLQDFATQEGDAVHYLDGIIFSPTKGAIITGRLADLNPQGLKVQRFSRSIDPWYFMHVGQCISAKPENPWTELMPLPDYVFRYNRGSFWCGKSVFDMTSLPFKPFTRRMLDPLLRTRMLYKAMHSQVPTTLMMIQDLALPFAAAEKFIAGSADRFGIWPLWLCPLRVSRMPTLHPHALKASDSDDKTPELMLNIGLYGACSSIRDYEDWITANQDLEHQVAKSGGMKWAYAAQLYPEDRFWEPYDKEHYESLREKCHATSLPNIYDKTKVDIEAGRKVSAEMKEAAAKSLGGRVFGESWSNLSCVWDAVKSRAWRLERRGAWKDWPEK